MPRFREYTGTGKEVSESWPAKQLGLAVENRKLLQQLVHSRNEWASTFDSIPDYILVHDLDYRILRANSALLGRLQRTRGRSGAQSVRRGIAGGGHKLERVPLLCARWNAAAKKIHALAAIPWFLRRPTRARTIHACGTVHVIKDITESKAAEERFTSLFNHMHEGVFVSTPEGNILDCNEAFVRMLGYDSKEDILKLDVAQSVYVDMEDRNKFLSEIARPGFCEKF